VTVETLSTHACHGGTQGFYKHASTAIGLPMAFGVFTPPHAKEAPCPVLVWLAGLTCTHETFAIKAGGQRLAAELGLVLVTPDTSPRDTGIAGADAHWDFGHGAGFYLDATAEPWRQRFRMESYVVEELTALLRADFAATCDVDRLGVFGHSMGGHGALTLALRHPDVYRSVSAFAPVAAPMRCPWGEKAFTGYLGLDRGAWAEHDAAALVASGKRASPILVDQGLADQFLAEQLRIDDFEAACRAAGQPLELRRHGGYDHGYWFVQTFVEDHLRHHAQALG
jgi:S-formylglutathione hydrolase